jgi:DNA excision repair protein ERCC-3
MGETLPFQLRPVSLSGHAWSLRPYQLDSVERFHAGGDLRGGSGVIVLPCGAGKTMVGMGAMSALQTATLILTPSTVAARQWIQELLDKTTLTEDQIGEYTGLEKTIRPVTIATYQIMTYRKRRLDEFPHFALFNQANWGLIIYDEVHLLPAPVFRITAELQARRRLGLTATLVREDGRQTDVFSLIGPKKYDVPWKVLEKQGWIAEAECYEIRVPLQENDRMTYALTPDVEKYHYASGNPAKYEVLDAVLEKHPDDNILIIGMYLDQLDIIAKRYDAPLITGKTPVREREKLFARFRSGEVRMLVVSKVANFAIDLPDANVAIQISGTFGSRQEEAQRLGRILRPKQNGLLAHFYSIVTRDTRDQDFAANRQLFLTEQGYHYTILYAHELARFSTSNTFSTFSTSPSPCPTQGIVKLNKLLEFFTISKIENEVPPALFKKAYRLVQSEAVFIEEYDSRHIEGTVEEDGEEYYPEITSNKDGFEILCSCIDQENDLCVHLVALLIEWVTQTWPESASFEQAVPE